MNWIQEFRQAYGKRHKGVMLLTGDVQDLFAVGEGEDERYISLEQRLVQLLHEKMSIIRMDAANGISFYRKDHQAEIFRVAESTDGVKVPDDRANRLRQNLEASTHRPLVGLQNLKALSERYSFINTLQEEKGLAPLCIIIQDAGSLFPDGDWRSLSELDRQRLVLFKNWIRSPEFVQSNQLVILISDTASEVNGKIRGLPNAEHIEIPLPNLTQRSDFVAYFNRTNSGRVEFEGGKDLFVADTAGLDLPSIRDLLMVAHGSKRKVTRADVVAEVNKILQAKLGDVIRVVFPEHGPNDIIGYEQTGRILKKVFKRCEKRETAVAAVLVSGPNGGGKTFQLEAFASASGRIVIELANLRGSLFGETDRLWEQLRWHIATFGKILILVDEAHTAFGSVHSVDTHPTEKRLAGNIIKMMGNPFYRGKVLWGLMTSRPDELDPDIKSRSPIQIPVFDLEGKERRDFVRALFKRKGIELDDNELTQIMSQTEYFSNRDYDYLVAEVLAARDEQPNITPVEVLLNWKASSSIVKQRQYQTLVAAQHCSYPDLLPPILRGMDEQELSDKVMELKYRLMQQLM